MEDSKLVKFRTLIDEVDKNFPGHYKSYSELRKALEFGGFSRVRGGGVNTGGTTTVRHYDLSICNEYRTNPFVEVFCKYFSPIYEYPTFSDLSELVNRINNDGRYYSIRISTLNAPVDRLIFWLLFVAAIDDEFYNKELSTVIDFAYCAKFNEGMIRDWCRAVEYVLSGNRFSKNCDLEMETAEGKKFFIESYGCQNN